MSQVFACGPCAHSLLPTLHRLQASDRDRSPGWLTPRHAGRRCCTPGPIARARPTGWSSCPCSGTSRMPSFLACPAPRGPRCPRHGIERETADRHTGLQRAGDYRRDAVRACGERRSPHAGDRRSPRAPLRPGPRTVLAPAGGPSPAGTCDARDPSRSPAGIATATRGRRAGRDPGGGPALHATRDARTIRRLRHLPVRSRDNGAASANRRVGGTFWTARYRSSVT